MRAREKYLDIIFGFKTRFPALTANFFETDAIAAPTKLKNPTVLGQGCPVSTNEMVTPHQVLLLAPFVWRQWLPPI